MLARALLRIVLVVLLLGSVLVQILVPMYASMVGTYTPEVAYLVVPYSVAAILFIACGQVALLAVWRLLSLVDHGTVFTRRALRWVDVIAACAVVATILSAVVWVHMILFVPGGGGPMSLYLIACVVAGLACSLLVVVVRGVLESAIADHPEIQATT
jgi:Protein of unknown function (DUF2975)